MKRLALLLSAAALLCLCACTLPGPSTPTPTPSPASTAAPTAEPAAPAPTATPAPTAAPAPSPAPTEAPEPTPEADCVLNAGDREYPACRFSGDLTGSGMAFTCLLPLEEVTSDYAHNAWVFRCGETPEAFLELSFITGGDVESLLPGFMDGYLDFTEIEFSEAAALGQVRGDVGRVSAVSGDTRAEGWLLDASGGAVCAALVFPADAPEAEALLRAMLDSFDLG